MKLLDEALTLSPKNPEALFVQAILKLDSEPATALELVERLEPVVRDPGNLARFKATILDKLGRTEDARATRATETPWSTPRAAVASRWAV